MGLGSTNSINAILRVREDTNANWVSSSYIPESGEPVFSNDTELLKIGDGVQTFSQLRGLQVPKTYVCTTAATSTYYRIAQIPLSAELRSVCFHIKAYTASGTITESIVDVNMAIRSDNYGSHVSNVTANTSHSFNTASTNENGWVLRYIRVSFDDTYAYLDIYDYCTTVITVETTPLTLNEWEWSTGALTANPTIGSRYNVVATLNAGLSGNAVTATYATSAAGSGYSNYGVYLGTNLADVNDKTGLWSYIGYFTLTYNANYPYGHSFNNEISMKELAPAGTKLPNELEDFRILVKGVLGTCTSTALFNTTVPAISLEIEGNTQLENEDVAALVYSTSTSAKVIRLYVKYKNPNAHYDIQPQNRYGRSYNSAYTNTTSYCLFTYASNQPTIEALPTPAQGDVVYATVRQIPFEQVEDLPWSKITNTPATLDGYGITNGVTSNTAITGSTKCKITYDTKGLVTAGADLTATDIPNLSWNKITSDKPTTLAGYGITNGVVVNSNITAATKCKITYDAKGLVTAGDDLTASDIPNLSWTKITSDKPTTLAGYGITNAQPLDGDLTAIAALAGTSGLLKKTATDTWALDTNSYTVANTAITSATKCKITYDTKGLVTAGADLTASDIPSLSWTKITSDKPTSLSGYGITDAVEANEAITSGTKCKITYDTKGLVVEGDDLTESDIPGLPWSKISYGKPTTLTGYGITDAQPLDGDLTSIAALVGTNGFLKKTANNTWALDTAPYTHPTGDGNLHVPSTSTTNNGKFLMAGSTAGSLSWGTPANTTYSQGTGISISGATINHSNSTTAKATQALYPITVDAQGHVTGTGTGIDIGSGTTTYLRNDGTWATPGGGSTMVGATASLAGQGGLVPAPAAGDHVRVLSGEGTWIEAVTTSSINTTNLTGTLTAAGWSSGSQTVTVTGMTNTLNGFLLPSSTATDAQYDAFALMMPRITAQGANSLTIAAKGTVPTIAVPFEIFAPRITTNLVETTSHAASHAYNGADVITPSSIKASSEVLLATSAPTTSTAGVLKQILINTTTSLAYVCTAVNGSVYTWQSFGGATETLATVTARGATTGQTVSITNSTASTSKTTGALTITGGLGVGGTVYANEVYGGVWQDYAEYRTANTLISAGNCVVEAEGGKVVLCNKRHSPGAMIVSDTYGFSIGKQTENDIAVALTGRVLANIDNSKLKVGDPVCSGKNGTVSKMSRLECILFPDRILGTVSEIPTYETWGTRNIAVNNRVWIKVR